MPDCGYSYGGGVLDDRRQHPGVNRGKGRGVTKSLPKRRKRRK